MFVGQIVGVNVGGGVNPLATFGMVLEPNVPPSPNYPMGSVQVLTKNRNGKWILTEARRESLRIIHDGTTMLNLEYRSNRYGLCTIEAYDPITNTFIVFCQIDRRRYRAVYEEVLDDLGAW